MGVRPIRPKLVTGILLLGALVSAGCLISSLGGRPAWAQAEARLARILTDDRVWGEDAFAVFGSLDRWKSLGETSIVIYPDRVASGTASEMADPARQSATRMAAAMQLPRGRLRPEFAARYGAALAARAPALKAASARFLEDDMFRVVWERDGGEFLKKGLTVRAVLDAYGKPERTTTEVVHSRGDRRPAVLTLHHYANGAVKFVESDLASTPGLVDRVILDVGAAVARIFETTP